MESALLRPARPRDLLGRAHECARLDDLVAAIRRGQGRSVVLRGEAGIGKTALLRYLIESASDLTIVRTVGVESEMELAYASLHQLCAPMFDRLSVLPAPQHQALEIVLGLSSGQAPDVLLVRLAVLSLLSDMSRDRPLLCVVDDAQWLDRASVLALAFVARRLLADPVGIVFAARQPGQELRSLPDIEVKGLTDSEARALLGSVVPFKLDAEVRERIVAETRGNPLALLELPQGLTATQVGGGFGLLDSDALSGRIEGSFARRLGELSDDARRLLLLAAAEPVGDPLLVWRAAERLGISTATSDEATDGLLSIGRRVTFRHPLVRSAVYRSAAAEDRRAAHLALSEATDKGTDPDRRAWHLASAAVGPDEQVASELERSAARAQDRGGLAAAAAFLERSVSLSADPVRRSERALAAAQLSVNAGAFDAVQPLVTLADAGPLDEVQRARVDLLRAQLAFATSHGSAAPPLLLKAAKRLETLDVELARETYLDALSAVIFASRGANTETDMLKAARAAEAAPASPNPPRVADLLLDGFAGLIISGAEAAQPLLMPALRTIVGDSSTEEALRWFFLASVAAVALWDDEIWRAVCERHIEVGRNAGALSELPRALNALAFVQLFFGELGAAASLLEEVQLVMEATGSFMAPYAAVHLAAVRGRESELAALIDASSEEAMRRGQTTATATTAVAQALLYNGSGRYDQALAVAGERGAQDSAAGRPIAKIMIVENWMMPERIEAAARAGRPDIARQNLGRLQEMTSVGTDWALGIASRCRALCSEGGGAESLYREAIERLGRTRLRPELARGHLLYGEWLRREGRRIDAREQLRLAHEMLSAIGMEAFAERARKELLATGAKARKRTVETRDDLTPQERQIAELAGDGLASPEIGVRLFLSPRTVEWHLQKVFGKLGIHSRRELGEALAGSKSVTV